MPTVELALSPRRAHVRTARLVAVAIARRTGLDEVALDEVRLAVGEACSRAVRLHEEQAPQALVHVALCDDAGFAVTVTDALPAARAVSADLDQLPGAAAGGSLLPGVSLALVEGLAETFAVTPAPAGVGTSVTMSWSVAPV